MLRPKKSLVKQLINFPTGQYHASDWENPQRSTLLYKNNSDSYALCLSSPLKGLVSLLDNKHFHSGCCLYPFENIYTRFSIVSVPQVVRKVKILLLQNMPPFFILSTSFPVQLMK